MSLVILANITNTKNGRGSRRRSSSSSRSSAVVPLSDPTLSPNPNPLLPKPYALLGFSFRPQSAQAAGLTDKTIVRPRA